MQKLMIAIGNWISYLFFLGVWFVVYLFYQSYELLLLLVVLVTLCPVSIAVSFLLKKKIQISCAVRRKQVEKDQSFLIDFVIDNPTIWVSRNVTLTVEVENTFVGKVQKQYIVMGLRPHGKKQVTIECKGIYCGMMQIRVTRCELRDWLGLVLLKKKAEAKAELCVMPNLVPVQMDYEHLGRGEGRKDTELLAKKGDDVSEVVQIREYVPGDRLQNIHWKLSAKSQDFLVKDYSMPMNHDITLLLDFRRMSSGKSTGNDKGNSLDDVLELFFSTVSFLCDMGQEMYVCWVGGGRLREEHITLKQQLWDLIWKIYEDRPQEGGMSAYDYYSRLYSQEVGNTLYFCVKEALPKEAVDEQGIQMDVGEAVSVWL